MSYLRDLHDRFKAAIASGELPDTPLTREVMAHLEGRINAAAHARASKTEDINARIREAARTILASRVYEGRERRIPEKVFTTMQCSTAIHGKTPSLPVVRREIRNMIAERTMCVLSRTSTSAST